MKDDRLYWIWLSHACGQGSRTAVRLAGHFGDAKAVYKANEKALRASKIRLESGVLSRLLTKDLSEAAEILDWCKAMGVTVLCPGHEGYPQNLIVLSDAPMVLYVVGNIPDFSKIFTCAVVGTRKMTEYGKKCAYKFGYNLARCGSAVISGLARGIDTTAMTAALDAGGSVIAVLGNGIDIVYPKENEALMQRVLQNGCAITEYAPGTSPLGRNFPVRNRLISALSQAVLVVEGNMRSGSLITARHAFYQNKDIYAVPGQIDDPNAAGTNSLIKGGVQAVTAPEEIIEKYQFLYPHLLDLTRSERDLEQRIADAELPKHEKKPRRSKKKEDKPFAEEEKKPLPKIDFELLGETEMRVYKAMRPDVPLLPEEIMNGELPISKVMASLTMLEIAGAVEAGAGGYFVRHADDEEVGEPAITELDEGF